MNLLAVCGIRMGECGLWHPAGRWTRSAPAQSTFVDQDNAHVSFCRLKRRHASRQSTADNQDIAVDNLAHAAHRPTSGLCIFALTRTTSIAFSGQTSSHKKQFTHCLFPKGKTLSFLWLKWITFAPQS
jgi:hypothetical protein